MRRHLLLVGVLGVLPACLNPDISDEYPLTTQSDALGVADAGADSDEARDEEAEAAPIETTPAPDAADVQNRVRPRRSGTRR